MPTLVLIALGFDLLLQNIDRTVPLEVVPGGQVRVGQDRWKVMHRAGEWDGEGYDMMAHEIQVFRNGQRVKRFGEYGIVHLARLYSPAKWPTFMLKDHSAMGSGERTYIYGIKDRKFYLMAELPSGEIGGPIFRDLDGDGVQEWLVDDWDWYTYYGSGPKWYLVYVLTKEGRLRYLKKLVAKQRVRLPRHSFFNP